MAEAAPARKPRKTPADAAKQPLRLAAVDVGSNSLHMIVGQADAEGVITTLWRSKVMVGLGRASFPSRRLSRESIDQAIAALRQFRSEATRRQCEKLLAVATSAVREAENGGDFIERVRRELRLRIRVVSAREEARLIYLGVRHALDLTSGPHLILDIGGGSVEFIVGDEDRPALLESRKLGAARMTARFVYHDPITPDELKDLKKHYDRDLTPLCDKIRQYSPIKVIGTSGTLENIAAMCAPGGALPPADAVIEREPFTKLLSRLLESRSAERAKVPGLDEQRKDQIVAATVLVNELFRRLDIDQIHICRSAMREGILVDYLQRNRPEMAIRRQIADPRRRSVLGLARRCDWEQVHSEQVTRLSLLLFDQLQPLHGLGPNERELLEFGALLHDIGWHISQRKHHKHSMYLVLNGDLKGFTDDQVRIIANIARYHRKAPPKSTHEEFAALPAAAQRTVRAAAALLRIADGLDRSHSSVVSNLHCRHNRREARIDIVADADAALELWAARRKRDLFEDVFARQLVLRQKKG